MTVLTKTLIKESEEEAVKSGSFSYRELMYKAGNTAAEIIIDRFCCIDKKITVICGNGNNGGDGCVIAKYLYEHGADVTLMTPLGAPVTEDAYFYYSQLTNIKKSKILPDNCDIIIDAVFGIGLNRAPENEISELFEKVNCSKAIKVAIDVPSGVEADSGKVFSTAVKADLTVTFIALKPCLLLPKGSDYCGEVVVADIGVKPQKYSYKTIEKPMFSKRRHNSHKGDFGKALIICGSYGFAGAALLSAKAALRSGLGIAKCVVCDGIYSAFTASVPEAVCIPVKQSASGSLKSKYIKIPSLLKGSTAILFGCGVSVTRDTEKLLTEILKYSDVPLVIDADGINLLSKRISLIKKSKAPLILTPHPAEMARLCGVSVMEIESNRIEYARNFAAEHNCVVVLKGANTIVAQPCGQISFNTNGNPGMSTGGSGDVLAGVLVSLLAQGMPAQDAAKAAVYLHGEAADKASLKKGERAMLPSDIIEEL